MDGAEFKENTWSVQVRQRTVVSKDGPLICGDDFTCNQGNHRIIHNCGDLIRESRSRDKSSRDIIISVELEVFEGDMIGENRTQLSKHR